MTKVQVQDFRLELIYMDDLLRNNLDLGFFVVPIYPKNERFIVFSKINEYRSTYSIFWIIN